jgi:uncharacterized protein YkwD
MYAGALVLPCALLLGGYLALSGAGANGGGSATPGTTAHGTILAIGQGAKSPGAGDGSAGAEASGAATTSASGGAPTAGPGGAPPSAARSGAAPENSVFAGPESGPSAGSGSGSTSLTEAELQVFDLINQERKDNGLPPYTITAGLMRSAGAHDAVMASGCGLSHQCHGEEPLGTRETDAGVRWTAAGENIGEGGPVADTQAGEAQLATGLTTSMYNETPPDDGHRLNILNKSYKHIGIAVYRDSSGTVWLTQDFSN